MSFLGHKHSEEAKRKVGLATIGNKNSQWKGDEVGYHALHDYVKYHLPKPEKCQNCQKFKKLELANISQKYLRDLSDWEWLCRSCHMIKDGRIHRLIENAGKANLGKKVSIESRQKMSLARKLFWQNKRIIG